jgi:hypothetical protein
LLSLLLLCSCATTPDLSALIPASKLPAEVTLNKDAGRGSLLFVTLRLEDGEELLFIVDTGSPVTFIDKSFEPKLAERPGTAMLWNFGSREEAGVYAAPQLYMGSTPLMMTGADIFTHDFKELSSKAGRPIMGLLGMNVLMHYCIQLDFEAGKMRFLDPDQTDAAKLGKAFPLTFSNEGQSTREFLRPYIHTGGLIGGEAANVMIDTGYRSDGALESRCFRREVLERRSGAEGDAVDGKDPGRVWFKKCVWDGETYTNLLIGKGGNLIGLRFLARHLVTLEFPERRMYLKRISVGPPVDGDMEAAAEFLKNLMEKGQVPGWSKSDKGTIYLEANPNFEAFDGRKSGESSTYHYTVARASEGGPWKLEKAWRTDLDGHTIEEYPVP